MTVLHVTFYFGGPLCCRVPLWSRDISLCCCFQVRELPAPIYDDDTVPTSGLDDKMTIAWRYQNMREVQSSSSSTGFGHYYDLTKYVDHDMLKAVDIHYWSGPSECRQAEGKSVILTERLTL
jgi:hypothetical protein